MKTFYIDWLNPCRRCGKKDAQVKTIHGSRTRLWEDDGVRCRECGLTGIVQACEGYAWCLWDEVENDQVTECRIIPERATNQNGEQ